MNALLCLTGRCALCCVFGIFPASAAGQVDCGWSDAPAVLQLDGSVAAMVVHNDGSGLALYAVGDFVHLDGQTARYVARWDGSAWEQVGEGLEAEAHGLAVFDAGDGARLYVSGTYNLTEHANLAVWDGSTWTGVPETPGVWLGQMGVSSIGGKPELYVSGPTVDYIRRWDGSTWRSVGSGLHGIVWDYAEFDDGSGLGLFVGGWLGALYKFDGTDWSAIDGDFSVNGSIMALAVFDDGTGEALYVGGGFTRVPPFQEARYIAKWDGSTWTQVGEGFNDTVLELTVFDDGSGPALYAAGEFTRAGEVFVGHIARWDGNAWQPVDGGTDGPVATMCTTPAGWSSSIPEAMYLGGSFTTVGNITSPRFAALVTCACPADFNGDGTVDTLDVLGFLNAWSAGDATADFNGDGAVNTLDMLEFLNAWNIGC